MDGNQEFIGQGLSNICGSFFSSYVATGSFNRSGINFEAGARTPLAAIIAGLALIPIVVFVAPVFAYLPNAALAGILFLVAWGIVDVHQIRTIVRASRSDSAVLWITFGATLLLDLDFAILLGVLLSLVIYLHRASRPGGARPSSGPATTEAQVQHRPDPAGMPPAQAGENRRGPVLRRRELRG